MVPIFMAELEAYIESFHEQFLSSVVNMSTHLNFYP